MTLRVELITPRGESALAVLRLTGASAASRLVAIGAGPLPAADRPVRRVLVLPGQVREQAIVWQRHAGGFELHLHGSRLLPGLVAAALNAPLEIGSPADLRSEIEMAAASAPSWHGLATCLAQLGPHGLLALAHVVADGPGPDASRCVEAALAAGARARPLLEPPRVVLRGRTNAGKSTLFNLLVGRERARVGPQPALTRDPVEELVVLEGRALLLVDTAGEGGEAHGDVDAAAVAAGRRQEAGANLTLWLHSALDALPPPPPATGWLRLGTHADRRPAGAEPVDLPFYDLLGTPNVGLRRELAESLVAALCLPLPVVEPAWLVPRQRLELLAIDAALRAGDNAAAASAARRLLAAR